MVVSNTISSRSHLMWSATRRGGLVSVSNSRSKSTSTSSSTAILAFAARRSFQHIILARIANNLGSIAFRSFGAYTAKNGSSLTINVTPRVHAVDELSRNNDRSRLFMSGCFIRIGTELPKDGPHVRRFNRLKSWRREDGVAKCLLISSKRFCPQHVSLQRLYRMSSGTPRVAHLQTSIADLRGCASSVSFVGVFRH